MISYRRVDNNFFEVLYMYSLGIIKNIKLHFLNDNNELTYIEMAPNRSKNIIPLDLLAIEGKLLYFIDVTNDK